MTETELRNRIAALVAQFHQTRNAKQEFIPGKTPVRYAGRVFDEKEIQAAVEASLDFWLTEGRFAEEFQSELAAKVGVEHAILTNSGSSANLLALTALTSPLLGERRLQPGDEVITVAAGFPTTVNPIILNNLIPVFVDVDIPTIMPLPIRSPRPSTPKPAPFSSPIPWATPFISTRSSASFKSTTSSSLKTAAMPWDPPTGKRIKFKT